MNKKETKEKVNKHKKTRKAELINEKNRLLHLLSTLLHNIRNKSH